MYVDVVLARFVVRSLYAFCVVYLSFSTRLRFETEASLQHKILKSLMERNKFHKLITKSSERIRS